MEKSFKKLLAGYQDFREKYASDRDSVMRHLAHHGQNPDFMVVACSDSRVDPALLLQTEPGDVFVVRDVANIVPPFEKDNGHHGVSAALEFGICYLNIKHLIILGHSQCGGIQALLNQDTLKQDDFISNWMSLLASDHLPDTVDQCAQQALLQSYQNCLSFPWIKQRVDQGELRIHLWFFDIKNAEISAYNATEKQFQPLAK
jgi:carbonic anhydrase